MSTDVRLTIEMVIETFVSRWSIEVTFREAKEHLGVETQRQWSNLAIARTTPLLFALYSFVAIIASNLPDKIFAISSAWYKKEDITFSDMIRHVKKYILEERYFYRFMNQTGINKSQPTPELITLIELLAQAA